MFGHLKIVMKCIFLFILWVLFLPVSHFFFPFFALQLGNCVAKDANPPANITWFKNNKPLEADGKGERSPSLLLSLSSKKIYLTFMNIAYTDGFILSDRDSCCKLFCCDELCCTLMTARLMTVCSVLVIAHFFLVRVFRQCLFVFCLGISIKVSVVVESSTGLSTTTSTLEYSAMKEDTGARFKCRADGLPLESSSMNFTITCESLSVLCLKPFILISFFCL